MIAATSESVIVCFYQMKLSKVLSVLQHLQVGGNLLCRVIAVVLPALL